MNATSTWLPALPEIILAASACLVLLVDAYAGAVRRTLTPTLTVVTLLIGVLLMMLTSQFTLVTHRELLFGGLYVTDPLAVFLKLVGFATMATVIFYSQDYLDGRGLRGGEYYVLCLTALLGVFVLVSANSLLTVYLGIELLSLSLYAMVAFDRDSGIAAEAAIKYFVLGAIASGVLLYGMSMLYGLTGTLDLDTLAHAVRHGPDAGLIIGVALVVVAVAFKFGAVPFHMWVPDVYQGAPTSVTLYIATVSNLGSFALFARLLSHGLAGLPAIWTQMVMAVAVLSLLIGNLVAIAQTNLKRMLAYSAIANAGFVLLGFATGTAAGYQAALNFTIAYVLTTLGAFGMILMLARAGYEHDEIADFKGLATRDPLLALLMLVLMFSTAGVPPFIGFWAKLWIIQALLGGGHVWVATYAVLISVVGAYYYLRVVWYMYFEGAGERGRPETRGRMRFILTLNAAAVLLLGLLPNGLLSLCGRLIGAG
ncbi:MAG TPA: NADH-quinone oxidoreductase subunit NuoN [Steroidobacteraceae bacterium]|nr:NADH-quinone oxidoreductase subunit NuoN [Steroidobacteraceae bacterium]